MYCSRIYVLTSRFSFLESTVDFGHFRSMELILFRVQQLQQSRSEFIDLDVAGLGLVHVWQPNGQGPSVSVVCQNFFSYLCSILCASSLVSAVSRESPWFPSVSRILPESS